MITPIRMARIPNHWFFAGNSRKNINARIIVITGKLFAMGEIIERGICRTPKEKAKNAKLSKTPTAMGDG
jgi:hypothetical protein